MSTNKKDRVDGHPWPPGLMVDGLSKTVSPLNPTGNRKHGNISIEESYPELNHRKPSSIDHCNIEKICKRTTSVKSYNLSLWGSNMSTDCRKSNEDTFVNDIFEHNSLQHDTSLLKDTQEQKDTRPRGNKENNDGEQIKEKKLESAISLENQSDEDKNDTTIIKTGGRSVQPPNETIAMHDTIKQNRANKFPNEEEEKHLVDDSDEIQEFSQMLKKFDHEFPDDKDDKTLYELIIRQGVRTKTRVLFDSMMEFADSNGFEMKDSSPNGDCMFQSVIDQMRINGEYRFSSLSLRGHTAEYLRKHPTHKDGTPLECFLLDGQPWCSYLERISQPKEWGDHIILQTLSDLLRRKIIVCNASAKDDITQNEILPNDADCEDEAFYLGHLGELHYLSLRPKGWRERLTYKKIEVESHGKRNLVRNNKDRYGPELFNPVSSAYLCHIPLRSLSFVLLSLINLSDICRLTLPCAIKRHDDVIRIETAGGRSDGTEIFVKHRDPSKHSIKCDRRVRSELPLTIVCSERKPVVCNDEECDLEHVICAETDTTHPGYCRLLTMSEQRIEYLHGSDSVPGVVKGSLEDKRSVCGLFCPEWPSSAKEWLSRRTSTGWPNPRVKEKIVNAGCLVVNKPHPQSMQPDIEWQFLFSFGEKILMKESMSFMQMYAYYILKLCIDYHTHHLKEKLHTAHIKSVVFFMCEDVDESQFKEFFGDCFLYLIQRVLDCLRNRHFPNYFIRENNMIDHFKNSDVENLIDAIRVLQEYPVQCIAFMMGEHGHHRSWIVDIFERYHKIHTELEDKNQYICQLIFPVTIRMAQKCAVDEDYYNAYMKMVQSRVLLSTCPPYKDDKPIQIPSLEDLIKDALKSLDEYTKCAVAQIVKEKTGMQIYSKVGSMNLTHLTEEEFKDEFADYISFDFVGSVYMEARDLNSQGVYLHNQTPRKCEEAVFYYLAAIDLLDKEINSEIENIESDKCVKKSIIYEKIARYDSLILLCFENLVCAYNNIGQIKKIKPRMPQLESVCKRVCTPRVDAFVQSVWAQLGHPDRGFNLH